MNVKKYVLIWKRKIVYQNTYRKIKDTQEKATKMDKSTNITVIKE